MRSLISSKELCSWQSPPGEPHSFPHLLICSSHDITFPPTGARPGHCRLQSVSQPQPCVPASRHYPPACRKPAQRCPSCGASSLHQEPWNTYFPSKRERRIPLPRQPPPHDISFYMMMSLDFERECWEGNAVLEVVSPPRPHVAASAAYLQREPLSPLPES